MCQTIGAFNKQDNTFLADTFDSNQLSKIIKHLN